MVVGFLSGGQLYCTAGQDERLFSDGELDSAISAIFAIFAIPPFILAQFHQAVYSFQNESAYLTTCIEYLPYYNNSLAAATMAVLLCTRMATQFHGKKGGTNALWKSHGMGYMYAL